MVYWSEDEVQESTALWDPQGMLCCLFEKLFEKHRLTPSTRGRLSHELLSIWLTSCWNGAIWLNSSELQKRQPSDASKTCWANENKSRMILLPKLGTDSSWQSCWYQCHLRTQRTRGVLTYFSRRKMSGGKHSPKQLPPRKQLYGNNVVESLHQLSSYSPITGEILKSSALRQMARLRKFLQCRKVYFGKIHSKFFIA